ncbi:hypothetical protein ASF22_02555 [Methylobacterium sp. Leaf87]|uniref:hypothetical protein n=1 Tax=Methylobacterium sp. Leaf87 TaxID=1736243 RepID=UPI00070152C9|nr:hypothetical protein [Methylobacterium sp. Leaf87]KQO69509.1 hypothetical protein ASF22_02555 [Methylobacterium sp. Leaf87]
MSLEIDFETRSDVDLRKHGAYRYFASPHTAPLMASYKLDNGPVRRWRPPAPCPADIVAHVEAGRTVVGHNVSFERGLWQNVLTPRYGWPALRLEQCRCTAATAAAMSLPRALGDLGAALGLDVQKDKEGSKLIRRFSLPRKPRGDEPPGLYFNDATTHPDEFERFHDYCDVDVETEAAADARMIPLSDEEQELWIIDQRINDRGIRVDVVSARAALALADEAKRQLDREMRLATDGYVPACSQPGKLVEWVQGQGVGLPSAAKAEIEELLECDDLPANVRRAVEIRQEAAKTSVAKLSSFLDRASDDGRIRGAFLFCAAGTGRWSSVGAQLHNLPRPRKEFGDAHLDPAALFGAIRTSDPGWLRDLYGEVLGRPLWLISDALRGFLWAGAGNDLLVADYSGIEGAVAAWEADEAWKVQAMFDLIADPTLPDLYRRSAAGIFNVPVDQLGKKDVRRQVGKVSELSLQYQGGVGAFRSMARNYSLKIDPVYAPVWAAADEERREKAVKRYEACCKRGDPTTTVLSREGWLAAELVKVGWRATHPAIVGRWSGLEDAIRAAIQAPGQIQHVGRCSYVVKMGFLWCRLPSGRCLAYGAPRLRSMVWFRRTGMDSGEVMARVEAEAAELAGEGKIDGEAKKAATALGVNSVTKKWERFGLYGGLAFENIVQAIARDLLAEGIKASEAAGYPVIGHVHDEIITEVPRGFGDVAEFERLICELKPWAAGLPLTASGWRGKRYRKD